MVMALSKEDLYALRELAIPDSLLVQSFGGIARLRTLLVVICECLIVLSPQLGPLGELVLAARAVHLAL